MLKRLFGHRPAAATARTPEGMAIYAIGDVHGRADLLRPLLGAIVDDAATLPEVERRIVLLGDYVDRGQDSRGVLELLCRLGGQTPVGVQALLGNHDRMLLDFIDTPEIGPTWCQWGGRETLLSYGVQPPAGGGERADWPQLRDTFADAVPAAHLAFLRSLELSVSYGDYFFVHAGVRPGVALAAQTDEDLLWIREPFLTHTGDFGKTIVHGHTAATAIHVDPRRVAIDTGAYGTNRLTAVRLRGAERTFLQTRKDAGRIVVSPVAV